MRPENSSTKSRGARGAAGALLDAPEDAYASQSRRVPASERSRGRDSGELRSGTFGDSLPEAGEEDSFEHGRQRGGYKVRLSGRLFEIPRSLWGRVLSALAILAAVGCIVAAGFAVRRFFLHDARFVVESSSSIQTVGNTHLTRAQLLSVFGGDVERNIFNIPLAERRAELESLPWIEHATVMRLLPNHLRISVVERTPVAFVRQGRQIGLVDAKGVLLDMPPDAPGDPHYSFPVVTGLAATDPASQRAARMRLYAEFVGALDGSGQKISQSLSEIDLSNPEDIKALIPNGSSDVLVHFGDGDFLARYQRFEQHVAEWRTLYPKLAAVDVRYERQVVLDTQGAGLAANEGTKGASAATGAEAGSATPAGKAPVSHLQSAAKQPPAKAHVAAKSVPVKPAANPNVWHMVVVKPHTKAAAATPAKAGVAPATSHSLPAGAH